MKRRVWPLCIFICCFLGAACGRTQETQQPVSKVAAGQDTMQLEPDFSYEVPLQQPHIFVDTYGYRIEDKKVAFFYGNNIQESFEIREEETAKTVFSGTLYAAREINGKTLYTGIFTDLNEEGSYYVYHEQMGDSYVFTIDDYIYNKRYSELEKKLLSHTYNDVSEQAYFLANYLFIHEMFDNTQINIAYVRRSIEKMLNSQDAKTGAFIREMMDKPLDVETQEGTISLTTTAQAAGVLAQYVYLYRDMEDAVFINQCLRASQKAYKYVEKYRDNTDTDAWYFAATQLYRTTRQYIYNKAIIQYDTVSAESRSSTPQGYTILADFIYLSTPFGTDYKRCVALLDGYLEKAQEISTNSYRENFYVLKNIDTMSQREILEDMFILGVVNHVLSGQEYAGIQKNYIHYLSGVNMKLEDSLDESMLQDVDTDRINTANAVKMLLVYANLYTPKESGVK